MGRGLALGGEVGGQNHLLHLTVAGALKQFFQPNVLGANAIERAELAHQDKVQPFVGAGTLNGGLVGRGFNHAQLAHVAPRIQASGAHLILREGVAAIAVAHLLGRLKPGGVACLQLPTYRNGYLFEVARYLNTAPVNTLEMHFLPQPVVFGLAQAAGCDCLEVREDGMVGDEDRMLSNTFVFQKRA